MAISTKTLKQRIGSIKNTQKITKAMELVAAAKMRKAVNNITLSRTYSELAWSLVQRLKAKSDPSLHILLHEKEEIKKVLLILYTSNRGLCGGYNTQIMNKTLQSLKLHADVDTDFIIIGKKGRDMAKRFGQHVIAAFDKEDVINQVNEVFPISKIILDEYMKGNYDKVLVAFNDFESSLKQTPRVRQILPITEKDEYIGELSSTPLTATFTNSNLSQEKNNLLVQGQEQKTNMVFEYLFEPSPSAVLQSLLPRLIEVQIYQAYLEANASEHSARMLAMRNASDSAKDMIDDLTLTFNQARQSSITQEIAEISAGKAVLD